MVHAVGDEEGICRVSEDCIACVPQGTLDKGLDGLEPCYSNQY